LLYNIYIGNNMLKVKIKNEDSYEHCWNMNRFLKCNKMITFIIMYYLHVHRSEELCHHGN